MMISGIGASNGTQNKVPSADLRSIESKIQKLKQQLKQVKGDDQIPPEEKEKRIQKLEEQIKRLEEQKRKLEQKEENKASDPGDPAAKSPSDPPTDENLGNYVDTWG
jgi:TolA-binding protein